MKNCVRLPFFALMLLLHTNQTFAFETKVEQILPTKPERNSPWGEEPDRLKDLKILDGVDEANSLERWKEANREYSQAIEGFELQEKNLLKKHEEALKAFYYEDRYDWQKKARKDRLEKDLQKKIFEARNIANAKLIKGILLLDKIENPKIKEGESYQDLKAGLFREYIKHQTAFKNYIQSIDFLERYIALGEKYEKEAEPHRLLALSYEKLETTATKAKNVPLAEETKAAKKKHLLRFAELHYGKESKEYLAIEEKVLKDI
ncbi:hypothetical protein LPTSP4_07100 [Leptospira ryugenii]|uniref:Uncharacterized protein n=2 Tax=Leptospira ryugenii TaxID=1917863 RepID=A0A2P2DXA1_9LEPT|nr:hypothetical protein LPTSP4_07100 [Leptospira ryugenii]